MPSSTSSSEVSSELKKLDRPLPDKSLRPAALIGLIVALVMMSGWEIYWRTAGSVPSYRNSDGLWAIERRRINRGEGDKTVIVGSSRAYFDTQLNVWERESGERPIQLALEGTSPVSVMDSLADDLDFTGTLLVGVAPDLFFSGFEYRRSALQQYPVESPTHRIGQRISMLAEPYLAFYHSDYSLFTVIKRQPFPAREGVANFADVRRLATYSRDRNARMWKKVENDPAYAEIVKQTWAQRFVPIDEVPEEELAGRAAGRNAQIERAVAATLKLKERGIDVIFIRYPAEGHYAISDPMFNPREETWDVLIDRTGVIGIHWMDHEELQGYWLPEWSHLSASEADRFTKALYHVIQRETGRQK